MDKMGGKIALHRGAFSYNLCPYTRFYCSRGTYNPLEILAERENIYRQLSQTADGHASNLKENYKNYTIEPTTRYRSIPTKIDHERILPLYDSDAQDELDCVREPFVNRAYYHPEKHRTMLQRVRRQVIKKTNMALPARVLRAARNFKKSTRARDQQEQPVEEQATVLA